LVYSKKTSWEEILHYGFIPENHPKINPDIDLIPIKSLYRPKVVEEKFKFIDLILPIKHNESTIAYVLLGGIEKDPLNPEHEQYKFIQTIASVLLIDMHNRALFDLQFQQQIQQKEMEVASKLQTMLIPHTLPDNEHIQLKGVYLPHADVGGDYYDCIKLDDDRYCFAIADIAGKGISAGLLMSNFQAHLHNAVANEATLEGVITVLNQRVCQFTKGEKYITFFIAVYNTKTREMDYINSGHNPPVLVQNNTTIKLEEGSTVLGMLETLPFLDKGKVTIGTGDILFMNTDGLTDLRDDEGNYDEFEELEEFLLKNHLMDLDALNAKLLHKIENEETQFSFIDDITILVCRFK
jgi:phosphoserine phosphatase RsbU/P